MSGCTVSPPRPENIFTQVLHPVRSDDSKPILLIIDDSEDVHRLLKARLRSEPLDIVSAMSGAEGLQKAKAAQPSVVLLDLDMPVMHGFAVLRELKNDTTLVNIPVIVLSGVDQAQDKITAFELGATDYVTKPFDFAELRARVRACMRTSQLLRLLETRAEVDGLTELANRAAFNRRWAQEVKENHRYGKPLSIAMMDADHFKKVNDTYGHPAGDEVLATLARIVRKCSRSSDIACRYGGEEFVLIMPHTHTTEASIVCERIREAVESTVWARHPEHKITISIGVSGAEVGLPQTSPEAWLEAADKALYTAKKSGRNRVVESFFDTRGPGLAIAS